MALFEREESFFEQAGKLFRVLNPLFQNLPTFAPKEGRKVGRLQNLPTFPSKVGRKVRIELRSGFLGIWMVEKRYVAITSYREND